MSAGVPRIRDHVSDAGRHGRSPVFLKRKRTVKPDDMGDPMASMGNLFDVAMLIGVGFLIMALSSMGLREMFDKADLTIVKNPGTANMEIITKSKGKITRLKTTSSTAEGEGTAIGTVYRLQDGQVIWVPDGTTAP